MDDINSINSTRSARIKKLRAKLINEEHRLVLMKKIRQAQTRPNNQQQQTQPYHQVVTHQQVNNKTQNQFSNSSHGQAENPAKKLRPTASENNQINTTGTLLAQKNVNLPPGTSSMNQTPAHAHQRSRGTTLWNQPPQIRQPTPAGIAPPHVGNLSRNPITTPPNVVQAMMGSLNALTAANNPKRQSSNNALIRQPISTPPNMVQNFRAGATSMRGLLSGQQSFNKSQAAQILVQKRTAAKQAVQKQLEQTLMQLPRRHIQLEIDFIPNANNIEFVCYLGLEACVDYLTDTKNPLDAQPFEKPNECSICGTDLTPSWSWKRSNPVCQSCVSNHVKNSLIQSQTNRIKSMLSKAAKQERDVDQKIMAEASNVVTTPTTSGSLTNERHSLLLQPASNPKTPRSSSSRHQPSANSSAALNPTPNVTTAPMMMPSMNFNNQIAALSSLQPAAMASLLNMNPQFGTLSSLMAGNVPPAAPPVCPPNNNNQLAQVAAMLINQLNALCNVPKPRFSSPNNQK